MNNYAVKPELIKNFIDVVIPSNPSFIKDFEVVKREGSLVPNSFAIVYELTDEYKKSTKTLGQKMNMSGPVGIGEFGYLVYNEYKDRDSLGLQEWVNNISKLATDIKKYFPMGNLFLEVM
jgi:hypothetical protein